MRESHDDQRSFIESLVQKRMLRVQGATEHSLSDVRQMQNDRNSMTLSLPRYNRNAGAAPRVFEEGSPRHKVLIST